MQHKKMQVAPKLNGRPPLRESVATTLGARSGRRSFAAELRSIVAAAHLLPAEVAPPRRVWRSLRVQLEKEGIFGHLAKGRLEEHTRFPMFKH